MAGVCGFFCMYQLRFQVVKMSLSPVIVFLLATMAFLAYSEAATKSAFGLEDRQNIIRPIPQLRFSRSCYLRAGGCMGKRTRIEPNFASLESPEQFNLDRHRFIKNDNGVEEIPDYQLVNWGN